MNKETTEIIGDSIVIKRKIETSSHHSKKDIIRPRTQEQVIEGTNSSTSLIIPKAIKDGTQSENIAEKIKKKRKPIVRIRFRAEDFKDVE